MEWIDICRLVSCSESVLSLLLNIAVLGVLWRRRVEPSARLYRLTLTVTGVNAVIIAMVQALAMTTHLFHDGVYLAIITGPLGWMGETGRDIIVVFLLSSVFMLWELIPAPCIMQYLALARCSYSDRRRLAISYAPCVAMGLLSFPFTFGYIPNPNFQPFLDAVVAEVFDEDPEDDHENLHAIFVAGLKGDEAFLLNYTTNGDFYAYAMTLMPFPDNNNSTVHSFLYVAVLPTYCTAYLIFLVTTYLIWQTLSRFKVKLSPKTAAMQRRFLETQVVQALVPLAVCGLPLTMFAVSIIAGKDLDRLSIAFTVGVYAVPIFQAPATFSFTRRLKVRGVRGEKKKSKQDSTARDAIAMVEQSRMHS